MVPSGLEPNPPAPMLLPHSARILLGTPLAVLLAISVAAPASRPAEDPAEVRFGTAVPWCSEGFLLDRKVHSSIATQVFVDGELAKDVDVVDEEGIVLTVTPAKTTEGAYDVEYREDSRVPRHPDAPHSIFTAEAVAGRTRYKGPLSRESQKLLDRDLDDPTEVHRFAKELSGRTLAVGEAVVVQDRSALQRLIGSGFPLEELEVRLDHVLPASAEGESCELAVFSLRTRGRSDASGFAMARTSFDWSGTLSLRVHDLLPVALELQGPLELSGDFEELGHAVRVRGEGSAKLVVRFVRPVPEVKDSDAESGAAPGDGGR